MWDCKRCTFKNDDSNTKCQVCLTPFQPSLPLVSSADILNSSDQNLSDEGDLMRFDIPILIPPDVPSSSASRNSALYSAEEKNYSKKKVSEVINVSPFSFNNLKLQSKDELQPSKTNNTAHATRISNCQMNHVESLRFIDNHFGEVSFLPDSTSHSSTLVSEQNQWACKQCTYVNISNSKECQACGLAEQSSSSNHNENTSSIPNIQESSSKVFMDPWHCPGCTYSNSSSSKICSMCKTNPENFVSGNQFHSSTGISCNLNVPFPSARLSENEYKSQNDRLIPSTKVRENDEKTILEKVEKIRSSLRKWKCPSFVDTDFHPSVKSLTFSTNTCKYKNYVWKKPYQIKSDYNQPWTVFQNSISPFDIQQGVLGNCWFLSGLAVLAERPELLMRVMITKHYNEEGVYAVRLCKAGLWQSVIIDDMLPCDENNRLVFSQSKRRQLFVPLIEKALAKLHGCYEALQAGRSLEGLATLTGAPCVSLQLTPSSSDTEPLDPNVIWAQLLSSMEAGFLMGASCGGGTSSSRTDEEFHVVGLRPRHAYSVLDVKGQLLSDGNQVKLVQLRNPWGQYSWNGDWSDSSPLWQQNPALKKLRNPGQSAKGTFWMALKDMLSYFDCVDICKIRDDWIEVREEGTFSNSAQEPAKGFVLTVYDRTEIDLSIFQQVSRSQEVAEQHPVDVCICIYRSFYDQDGRIHMGVLIDSSRRQVRKQLACNCFLEPGQYIVLCLAFNHWITGFTGSQQAQLQSNNNRFRYVLALHTNRPVVFDSHTFSNVCLADAVIALALKKGVEHFLHAGVCYYTLSKGWAGLILVLENRQPGNTVHIQCDCTQSSNVVSTRGLCVLKDAVPPLHRQVIVVLSQLDFHSSFSVLYKIKFRSANPGATGLGNWDSDNACHVPPFDKNVTKLHCPRPL